MCAVYGPALCHDTAPRTPPLPCQVVRAADQAASAFAETHQLRQVQAVTHGTVTWARRADVALLARPQASASATVADLRALWLSLQAAAAAAAP